MASQKSYSLSLGLRRHCLKRNDAEQEQEGHHASVGCRRQWHRRLPYPHSSGIQSSENSIDREQNLHVAVIVHSDVAEILKANISVRHWKHIVVDA